MFVRLTWLSYVQTPLFSTQEDRTHGGVHFFEVSHTQRLRSKDADGGGFALCWVRLLPTGRGPE